MKECDPLSISPTITKQLQKGAFLTVKAGDALNTMTIGWGLIGFIWQR
ncbi:MAG TPA: flavin reductase family protein, partial [Deltaproteobacteria bacterium]|nr:flavin reductase family protein [Deltaproteobacteria bacterium]